MIELLVLAFQRAKYCGSLGELAPVGQGQTHSEQRFGIRWVSLRELLEEFHRATGVAHFEIASRQLAHDLRRAGVKLERLLKLHDRSEMLVVHRRFTSANIEL